MKPNPKTILWMGWKPMEIEGQAEIDGTTALMNSLVKAKNLTTVEDLVAAHARLTGAPNRPFFAEIAKEVLAAG